ncbi:hypothetical protein [Amycolatopsis sp. cg9]|uniref:hypothetical protein n=1 Tax=Amycolatopsis sp. cg9 TaxID=3238801 RepID=UPI003523499F
MTVNFELLATLLPIAFTALFAVAFTVDLAEQWAVSRRRAHVAGGRQALSRGAQLDNSGRDHR